MLIIIPPTVGPDFMLVEMQELFLITGFLMFMRENSRPRIVCYLKDKNMVIYEVNLTIDEDIYSQFQLWLKEHAKEMLQLPGFMNACILKPENEGSVGKEKLTVQYQLENRESLNVYFNQFAAKMREEGLSKFKDKFSAERRIFEVQGNISN